MSTLPSSSDLGLVNHRPHQEAPAESLVHSLTIDSTPADNLADYPSDVHYKKIGSASSLCLGSELLPSPPGIGKTTCDFPDYEQSSVSRDCNDIEQTECEGPLKPTRGNISMPSRVSSSQLDNESGLPEKVSAITSTTPSNDENLVGLFEQMRIDSHELFIGGSPKRQDSLFEFTTPPSSYPKYSSSTRKLQAVPLTPRGPASNGLLAEMFADDWNCELSRPKQVKPVRPVTQSKEAMRKAKKMEFEATKESVAQRFLEELDIQIANGQVSKLTESTDGVKIIWTKSLHTTAGRANWRRETVQTKQPDGSIIDTWHKHHASIELADKVIDDEDRLLNVLAHEFCHLTTFMISGRTTNPHGKEFKSWASKCSRILGHRGIQVTTKHTYEIDFKYKWECADCGLGYNRHSKSIDTLRHRCGTCKGELKQVKPAPRANVANSGASRQSEYQLFVKDQMKLVRLENPAVPQRDILRMIAGKWADQKRGNVKKGGSNTTDTVVGTQVNEADVTSKLVGDLPVGD
ncbi:uncharacterized protein MAM_00136 [Metarhizium album ARSEF 1941]|uniref:SprT-like domain-containing protein n=1 Tax=Metarhizium album (strain ARSEF 1941) TaxID=1081103 RepID=A0A0B2X6N9_METAS|nr:uncharacterized protein MAM_00136 [Metarhizium album ARSEF 1941]KHO01135.1 hypothetical protein MAM_00136 [Metarhizium album ARSEF 1941]